MWSKLCLERPQSCFQTQESDSFEILAQQEMLKSQFRKILTTCHGPGSKSGPNMVSSLLEVLRLLVVVEVVPVELAVLVLR